MASARVSGSDDTTLRVWDLEGSQLLRVLEGHTSWVNAVALSADGKYAVSGSDDGTLRFWDLEGNQQPRLLMGHTGLSPQWRCRPMASAPSPALATRPCGSGIWRAASRRVSLKATRRRSSPWRFRPMASAAVSGSADTTLRVWDLEGNQPPRVLEGHTDAVSTVALSADGKRAVSGSSTTAPCGSGIWKATSRRRSWKATPGRVNSRWNCPAMAGAQSPALVTPPCGSGT